jgi:hypothetical protein
MNQSYVAVLDQPQLGRGLQDESAETRGLQRAARNPGAREQLADSLERPDD